MRMRTLRPEFFVDEDLTSLEPLARILFAGLWCEADREGRLEDRPRRLKMLILPADDADVDALLAALEGIGVIHRYVVDSRPLIQVKSFNRFQRPHVKESASVLPAMPRKGSGEEQPRDGLARPVFCSSVSCITESGEGETAPPPLGNHPQCLDLELDIREAGADGKASGWGHILAEVRDARGESWVMTQANLGKLGAAITQGCPANCERPPLDCVLHVIERVRRIKSDRTLFDALRTDPREER